jgi:hypothetical protein
MSTSNHEPMSRRETAPADRPRPGPAAVEAFGRRERMMWTASWGGVVVTGFVNGALHQAYAPLLGEPAATRVSEVALVLLLAPWVLHVERRHPLPRLRDAAVVGAGWAVATVAFELVFGHYVNGDPWETLLNAYDLLEGHLWGLDVLAIAAAPVLARAWRLRRSGRA